MASDRFVARDLRADEPERAGAHRRYRSLRGVLFRDRAGERGIGALQTDPGGDGRPRLDEDAAGDDQEVGQVRTVPRLAHEAEAVPRAHEPVRILRRARDRDDAQIELDAEPLHQRAEDLERAGDVELIAVVVGEDEDAAGCVHSRAPFARRFAKMRSRLPVRCARISSTARSAWPSATSEWKSRSSRNSAVRFRAAIAWRASAWRCFVEARRSA